MTKESIDEETMKQLTKLGDILQAVHDEEKNAMVRISEEKHHLSEGLDMMSTEIANLQSSIASHDRQENPQHAHDDDAALHRMLGAIELGHNRAEQLESKIGNLQTKIDKENAVDVNSKTEVQNACQALEDHRVQSNEIDTYTQALKSIARKIEGADESKEKLFQIAERLHKRLQECDEALETTNQSHEMELAKVQIELESANDCSLSECLESRAAHIRELEEKLFAKDKEVEATQQQLQILELTIDANKERARKLELELKFVHHNNHARNHNAQKQHSSWSLQDFDLYPAGSTYRCDVDFKCKSPVIVGNNSGKQTLSSRIGNSPTTSLKRELLRLNPPERFL